MAKEKSLDNLRLYNQFRAVPQEALKSFNNGKFGGTDINPMWRIKALTEAFGPCGEGWYFGKPEFQLVTSGDTITVHCIVALYHKLSDGTWSQPVYGVGGNTIASINKSGYKNVTDEGFKMAYTDACGIAAKQLGVGADVWFANDVTKYTAQQQYQPQLQYQQQQWQQPTTIQPETTEEKAVADSIKQAFHFDAKKAVDNFFASLDAKTKKAAEAFYSSADCANMPIEQWGPMQYELVCQKLIDRNKINRETGVKIA